MWRIIAADDGLVSNNYLFCVSKTLVAGTCIWRYAVENPAVSRRMLKIVDMTNIFTKAAAFLYVIYLRALNRNWAHAHTVHTILLQKEPVYKVLLAGNAWNLPACWPATYGRGSTMQMETLALRENHNKAETDTLCMAFYIAYNTEPQMNASADWYQL